MQRTRHTNQLLARLPAVELARLAPDLEPAPMAFKQTLYEQGKPIKHVWFPNSGVASLLTLVEGDDEIFGTGTIGREGFVGVPAFLGAEVAPGRALCQVAGDALRMEVGALLEAVERSKPLRLLLMHFTHALLAMTAQSVACIGAHPV